MFEYDGGKMKMNMDLDLNDHVINTPFFITGYFKKSKSSNRMFLNDASPFQIISMKCFLNRIVCYFPSPAINNDYRFFLKIYIFGSRPRHLNLRSPVNARKQIFLNPLYIEKNDVLMIEINAARDGGIIPHDEVVFSLTFFQQ